MLLGEADANSAYFWPAETYDELKIELRLGTRVAAIRPGDHVVEMAGGETLSYHRLMLATGSRPRELPVPGAELAGIHTLRVIPDTLAIRDDVPAGGTALIVGGGWIGLEVAAAVTTLGAKAIIVEAAARLCARALTPDMSAWLLDFHTAHGIDVRLDTAVARFEGDGALARAVLSDDAIIETTLAVVGIGIVPNTELAEAAGLAVENGVVVDEIGRTSDPDIFAAGDVTNHPNPLLGRRIRLESWENAQNQAINGAKAMLDAAQPYAEIPWFWSDQFDANLQLVGLPDDWDEEVTRGDRAAGAFITFYLKNGKIDGAVAVNQGRDLRFAKRLIQAEKQVSAADLANPDIKLQALLKG
jgi:3-phenylpropionate/trans-cinnamate dioxygenase ferredoxin reductase subunit